MQPVATSGAPTPAGHYAQGMVHGGVVYVSGQLPIDPATGMESTGFTRNWWIGLSLLHEEA